MFYFTSKHVKCLYVSEAKKTPLELPRAKRARNVDKSKAKRTDFGGQSKARKKPSEAAKSEA